MKKYFCLICGEETDKPSLHNECNTNVGHGGSYWGISTQYYPYLKALKKWISELPDDPKESEAR